MNKQKKDGNISWTDYTWNPIQGLCPVGCWYCFARKIYKRFKLSPELAHIQTKLPKKPCKIFVCSTIEMFHPAIPKEWRDIIFEDIKNNPQHTFQILTKMPQNIDRPMPDNVWLGVTVTKKDDLYRYYDGICKVDARVLYISYEPLLEDSSSAIPMSPPPSVDWIIVGRLTGHGHKYDPPRKWIEILVETAMHWKKPTPVFLKNNLKEIWGEKLIQEFPRGD